MVWRFESSSGHQFFRPVFNRFEPERSRSSTCCSGIFFVPAFRPRAAFCPSGFSAKICEHFGPRIGTSQKAPWQQHVARAVCVSRDRFHTYGKLCAHGKYDWHVQCSFVPALARIPHGRAMDGYRPHAHTGVHTERRTQKNAWTKITGTRNRTGFTAVPGWRNHPERWRPVGDSNPCTHRERVMS